MGKMTDEQLARVTKRAEAMVNAAPEVEQALLGCLAYFFFNIYGAPDGGGVPACFTDAIDAYAKAHAVGQGRYGGPARHEFVAAEIARYIREVGL